MLITDTMGRPWRNGQTDVAIGAAGVLPLRDHRGQADTFGNTLEVTVAAVADEIAAAASLMMGQAAEGRPVVIVRGLPKPERDGNAQELVRAKRMDLFR